MKFSVGDRVKIRSWVDMLKEFGKVSGRTSIDCRFKFTEDMRPLCGKKATIVYINDGTGRIYLDFDERVKRGHMWSYSGDMLEYLTGEEDEGENTSPVPADTIGISEKSGEINW